MISTIRNWLRPDASIYNDYETEEDMIEDSEGDGLMTLDDDDILFPPEM